MMKLCECCNPVCPVHPGTDCPRREAHLTTLRRVNMGVAMGTIYMCAACAAHAIESGVFAHVS